MTLIIRLKDKTEIEVEKASGGGIMLSPGADYEAHFIGLDDEFVSIEQKKIKEVFDTELGAITYDFGNKYMPGHPHYISDDRV